MHTASFTEVNTVKEVGLEDSTQSTQSPQRRTTIESQDSSTAASTTESSAITTQSGKQSLQKRASVESCESQVPSIAVEDEDEEAKVAPIDAWLDRYVVLVDCFGEVVDREKIEQADLVGVSTGS
jgi:hypothetical protein